MVGNDDGQWWWVRWVRWVRCWVRTVGNLVRAGCSGMHCASSRRVVDVITWSAHYFDLHHDYFARHQDAHRQFSRNSLPMCPSTSVLSV